MVEAAVGGEFQARRIDAYFFIIWGYITALVGLVLWALGYFFGHEGMGYLWGLTPVLGGVGTVLLVRRYRGRESLFSGRRREIATVWSIVGPGFGYVMLLCDNPLGVQLFLVGVAVSIHGGITHFGFARAYGIVCAVLSPLAYYLPHLWGTLVFGLLGGSALFLPGHVLLVRARRLGGKSLT